MAKKKAAPKEAPCEDDKTVINDPDNYARMILPHETIDEAEAAWKGFWADVYEARKKHRIAEAVVIGQVRWKDEKGELQGANLTGSMGNEVSVLRMLAHAYGEMKGRFEKMLMKLEQGQQPLPEEPKKEG